MNLCYALLSKLLFLLQYLSLWSCHSTKDRGIVICFSNLFMHNFGKYDLPLQLILREKCPYSDRIWENADQNYFE